MELKALHQISRSVDDLDSAVQFYEHVLQLRLIARFDTSIKLAFFDLFGTRLMLEEGDVSAGGTVIYLTVDDIDAAAAEMASRGAEVVAEPHPIHHDADGTFGPAGETEFMAFLKDPSGNLVSLVQRK